MATILNSDGTPAIIHQTLEAKMDCSSGKPVLKFYDKATGLEVKLPEPPNELKPTEEDPMENIELTQDEVALLKKALGA